MGKTHRITLLVFLSLCATPLLADQGPGEKPSLRVTKSADGALLLAWDEPRNDKSADPTIYEGSLDALKQGHWDLEPVDCDTGDDQSEEILPTPGSRYYLLVPRPSKRRAEIERGALTIPRPQKPSPCSLRRKP